MLTNEQKEKCDKRKEEIQNDIEFQQWIQDIRCSCNFMKDIQDDRISLSNQCKLKADGKHQRAEKTWLISQNQISFNEKILADRKELETLISLHLKNLISNETYPIWDKFLVNITGMGPINAAYILSRIRPENVYYVSNIYSFCGIVKGKDRLVKGQKSGFDVILKSRLLGVLGPGFIKSRSEYALYYYTKRIQLLNKDFYLIKAGKMNLNVEGSKDVDDNLLPRLSAMHHHRMAIRYMIQMFIRDYYVAYRTIMGIPVIPGYAEEKLDLAHVGEDLVTADDFLYYYNGNDYKYSAKEKTEIKHVKRSETVKRITHLKDTMKEKIKEYEKIYPGYMKAKPEGNPEFVDDHCTF